MTRLDEAMDGLGTCEDDVQCTGGAFCQVPGHVVTKREGRDGFQVVHLGERSSDVAANR